ncbi:hypothetical protein OAF42_00210 [Planctomicrobium sp.]|jgi:hypothetical protein|nr:hypothetical protein [Planctomicrobium sp.]MDB4732841.1 hypothetical protein [Planctomicrobium sp.]
MNSLIHPALWQLTKMRTAGKFRGMLASFTQPRKLAVSILGSVLALIWLSNVIASILFREKYDPESLRTWMTLSLSVYASWHFVRVAWQRPDASIEWSEAERNNLVPSPFTRQQLLQYRLATVLGVTTLKAAIGTILLLPDLANPTLGFLAFWCGLAFIELLRVISDSLAVGMGQKLYRAFRAVIVGTLITLGVFFSSAALLQTQSASPDSKIPIVFLFGLNFLEVLKSSVHTTTGEIVTAPFALFVELITARVVTYQILLTLMAAFSVLIVTVWTLSRLDNWSESSIVGREKRSRKFHSASSKESMESNLDSRSLPNFLIKLCGGAVTWRQAVGVYRYGTGVVLALIPPAILSAMPLFMSRLNDRLAILNFLGGLVFYSFLLLPSALKFDFRRDYSHLLLLKMLPLRPSRVVVGQLATPILLTTLFQYAMLAFACSVREMNFYILLSAVLSFPAMNFAVYGWENLMFLIFPQKLKQEGIEVFLRTTVLFTAKGVTCGIVFAMIFWWAFASTKLSLILSNVSPLLGNHRLVFGIGVWCSVTCVGVLMTLLAARQFKNLDIFPEKQAG